MADPTIAMIDRQDNEQLSSEYQNNRRIHIADFLSPESAHVMHQALDQQRTWNLVFDSSGKHTDMDFEAVSKWSGEQIKQLEEVIHQQAESSFQYYYTTVPIYDIYQNNMLPGHFFNKIYEFVNSPKFLAFARTITGNEEISFADVQATRYSRGHFLKEHDDNVAGKGRIAAYVLNLTPQWENDWGGALIINNEPSCEAFYPKYNALNIFAVPQRHSVSMVSPFAGANRYSITGWLRK